MAEVLHVEEVFGTKPGNWLWCLHCERAYVAGEYRLIDGLKMCPYEDCDGSTVLDGWEWSDIDERHPEYPEIPEKEVFYPLY